MFLMEKQLWDNTITYCSFEIKHKFLLQRSSDSIAQSMYPHYYLQLDILLLSHLWSRNDCTSPSDTTINLPSCLPLRTTLISRMATCTGNT